MRLTLHLSRSSYTGKENLYLINGLLQTPGGEVIDAKDAQKDVLSIPSGTLVELDADDQPSHCWYVTWRC